MIISAVEIKEHFSAQLRNGIRITAGFKSIWCILKKSTLNFSLKKIIR